MRKRQHACAQDLLYKPVALECGHIFCARCAINIAVGHDHAIGDADRLLTTLAAYSAAYTNRQCPSCRSTSHGREGMSVFWQPRSMKHLELLIKQRCALKTTRTSTDATLAPFPTH